ncbi:MAG: hypothetical protein FJ147_09590 [Deltaproteobacteria bacterium]|nr:hypothetical protein [Deltaproteobacteria bacterium]
MVKTDIVSTSAPTVWVLVDDRPGNTTQPLGLAHALGWPFTIKELHFTETAAVLKFFLGPYAATRFGVDHTRSAPLTPPWPHIIIAAGWRPAQVARWIQRQSRGATRLVQLGRKGGHVAGLFDVVISCSYFHQTPHPQRLETIAPLTRISAEQLQQAAQHWQALVAEAPHPRIMALVGGATNRHQFNATIAQQLGTDLHTLGNTMGGSLFVTTSRRTTTEATAALRAALGDAVYLYEWQPGAPQDNPYLAFLALADILVVTGESESMLAEAAATGKPFFIYPLPERKQAQNWRKRCKAWIKSTVAAHAKPLSDNHSALSGMVSYFCQWLIASGIVRPRRDLAELHHALIRGGRASVFGTPLPSQQSVIPREIDEVALKIKALLGFAEKPVQRVEEEV